MSRLVPSAVALVVAMSIAAPASAADWSDDWGGEGDDLRGSYLNEPKDWSGLGDEEDALSFEFGLRYWYSWGAQSASADGGVTTTSATDISHIPEAHLRIEDRSSNVYVKAWGGYAAVINGAFANPFGVGGLADGTIGYLGADVGWNAFGDSDMGIGALVGYQYWRDAPDTGRYNYTTATTAADITYDPVTGQTFLPGDSAPNQLDAHMLRLGIQGKANFNNFIDFTAEIAAVPYARVSGTIGVDDPTFDTSVYGGAAQAPYGGMGALGNISSIRSSPTSLDGWGYGGMAEAWVGIHPVENLVFRLGGRAWYIQGTADATYTRASIGNPSDGDIVNPPNFDTDPAFANAGFISTNNAFSMLRYGLMAEMTYAF
jgi:hypothetical protein